MPAPNAPKEKIWTKIKSRWQPIKFTEKIFLFENLRVMLKAGLSIVESLQIAAAQTPNLRLRKILSEVTAHIEKGTSLSETLEKFPGLFPSIYVKMVAAGEVAGKLDESLNEIVAQMKKTYALTAKIRGAMIYPLVILVAIVGIGVEMMVFVLPKILTIFTEMNVPLPLPTRILIATSTFLVRHGLLVAVFLVALTVLGWRLKKNPKIKRFWHQIILRLPIFGKISKEINLARFSLTLSSLLKSAVPIIDALSITAAVATNTLYQEALAAAAQEVKSGKTIAEILEKYPTIFPPLVTQMIRVGEKSGMVENLLNQLSEYYNDEVDQVLKNISTVIEPVIIIILGVVVGGLAVAVIMPMYSLSEAI
ncbi:MAG: type II secretion system F family protein [Candidatus Magasanikbacteria bacterium]|nr:type II secretion system F family protein [Candidatus Magasanikbacteria bacterium]